MIVGILSDSHDNREHAGEALRLFLREKVATVIHLGDVCSPVVIVPFHSAGFPVRGVFGNGDRDHKGLQAASGNGFRKGPSVLVIGGRTILMSHNFGELRGEIGDGKRFDLILFGHTHRPLATRVGRALVVNPGEACGGRSGRPTCAVVDLGTMKARILELSSGNGGGASKKRSAGDHR